MDEKVHSFPWILDTRKVSVRRLGKNKQLKTSFLSHLSFDLRQDINTLPPESIMHNISSFSLQWRQIFRYLIRLILLVNQEWKYQTRGKRLLNRFSCGIIGGGMGKLENDWED